MAQSCAVASRLISMALQRLEQLHAHGHGIKVKRDRTHLGQAASYSSEHIAAVDRSWNW